MSNISKLIEELCPDGVEFVEISSIAVRNKGISITAAKMKKMIVTNGPIRLFAAGQNFIDTSDQYVDTSKIIDTPSIIVKSRGHIGFEYYDKPFQHKSEMWSYEVISDAVNIKFLYYYLLSKSRYFQDLARATSVKLPQLSVKDTDNFRIPVPPLGVQEEIVRILDRFTLLEAELEAELEARKKQYAFYRNFIVTEHYDKYPLEKIENLCSFLNGKAHEKFEDEFGSAVLVTAGFISSSGVKKRCISTENIQSPLKDRSVCIVMSDLPNGKALAKAAYISDGSGFALNQRVCALNSLDESKLKPRYLYYFMNRNRQLLKYDSKQYQTHLKKDYFMRVKIPVPPLEEQQRIVDILDRFDALVNDISSGLPAEIAARRKQYEHYRDQLLTFKEREPADS